MFNLTTATAQISFIPLKGTAADGRAIVWYLQAPIRVTSLDGGISLLQKIASPDFLVPPNQTYNWVAGTGSDSISGTVISGGTGSLTKVNLYPPGSVENNSDPQQNPLLMYLLVIGIIVTVIIIALVAMAGR